MLGAVLLLGLMAAAVFTVWSIRRAVREATGAPAGPGAVPAQVRSPQTLEGALTLQLVAGEITGPQYRRAMATLAARDAERHPLDVPPDVTPPEVA